MGLGGHTHFVWAISPQAEFLVKSAGGYPAQNQFKPGGLGEKTLKSMPFTVVFSPYTLM